MIKKKKRTVLVGGDDNNNQYWTDKTLILITNLTAQVEARTPNSSGKCSA